MAAPMKNCFQRQIYKSFKDNRLILQPVNRTCPRIARNRSYHTKNNFMPRVSLKTGIIGTFAVAGSITLGGLVKKSITVHAAIKDRPELKPSKEVRVPTDPYGLKLTLYQFTSCPFCCKLRAVLNYYGFSYDVIEVNSVNKKQIKWSDYKKVPILVVEGVGKEGAIQLNDSSLIISVLESYMVDKSQSIEKLASFYPGIEGPNEEGKNTIDYPNKYFIMYQEHLSDWRTPEQRSEERRYRKWADESLVHMISPNVYRTLDEAFETFRYFDKVGEWDKNFSKWERIMIIYVGATVMWVMGKIIKRKYDLKPDVRDSLYDDCNFWVKQVGKRKFLGGDQPNLADLSVYGVLTSMEGCRAFQDALAHTKIGPWFYRMKKVCDEHMGNTSAHRR